MLLRIQISYLSSHLFSYKSPNERHKQKTDIDVIFLLCICKKCNTHHTITPFGAVSSLFRTPARRREACASGAAAARARMCAAGFEQRISSVCASGNSASNSENSIHINRISRHRSSQVIVATTSLDSISTEERAFDAFARRQATPSSQTRSSRRMPRERVGRARLARVRNAKRRARGPAFRQLIRLLSGGAARGQHPRAARGELRGSLLL